MSAHPHAVTCKKAYNILSQQVYYRDSVWYTYENLKVLINYRLREIFTLEFSSYLIYIDKKVNDKLMMCNR